MNLICWKLPKHQLLKSAQALHKDEKCQISDAVFSILQREVTAANNGVGVHIAKIISQFCLPGNLIVKYPRNHPYWVCLAIGWRLTIVYLNFSLEDSRDSDERYGEFGHPLAWPRNLVLTLLLIRPTNLSNSPFGGFQSLTGQRYLDRLSTRFVLLLNIIGRQKGVVMRIVLHHEITVLIPSRCLHSLTNLCWAFQTLSVSF